MVLGWEIQRFNIVFKDPCSFHLFPLLFTVCRLCPQSLNLIDVKWLPLLQASDCRYINPVEWEKRNCFLPCSSSFFLFFLEGKLSQKSSSDFKLHFLELYHIPNKISGNGKKTTMSGLSRWFSNSWKLLKTPKSFGVYGYINWYLLGQKLKWKIYHMYSLTHLKLLFTC